MHKRNEESRAETAKGNGKQTNGERSDSGVQRRELRDPFIDRLHISGAAS